MTPTSDDAVTAVVVARLEDLRKDFQQLRDELKERDAHYLPRTEFEAWRTGIGREIGDIKATVAAAAATAENKRAPWWAIAAVMIAAIGAAVTVIPVLAQGLGG